LDGKDGWTGRGRVWWDRAVRRVAGSEGEAEKARSGRGGCGSAGSAKEVRRGVGDGPLRRAEISWAGPLILSAFGENHQPWRGTERFLQSVCSPPAPSPPSPVRVFAAGACPYPKAAPSGLRCFQLRARVVTVCGSLGADSRSSAFVGVGTVSVEVSMMRD